MRDRDLDALAEALERAQEDRPAWWAGPAKVAAGPATAAVGLGVLLHLAHVDLGWLLMAMFYGSPFLAIAVVSFVVHAWRQNSTSPIYGVGQEVGQAEPGQVADQVGHVGRLAQDVEVGQVAEVAKPVPPTTVTVTVLPNPVAELPQAPSQPDPIRRGDNVYPLPVTKPEEEASA